MEKIWVVLTQGVIIDGKKGIRSDKARIAFIGSAKLARRRAATLHKRMRGVRVVPAHSVEFLIQPAAFALNGESIWERERREGRYNARHSDGNKSVEDVDRHKFCESEGRVPTSDPMLGREADDHAEGTIPDGIPDTQGSSDGSEDAGIIRPDAEFG